MPWLPNSNIETSSIGIGCAYLTAGSLTKYETRLIGAAYEAGARHFDVAPQYGLGTAERVLGKALKGKRDNVTITTKAGIMRPYVPNYKLTARALLSPVRSKLRELNKFSVTGGIHRLTGTKRRLDFSSVAINSSLNSSLAHLGTDYVDVFMLHSPQPEDVTEEVVDNLLRIKKSGKARSIGLATGREDSEVILSNYDGFFDCVQYSWSVLDPSLSGDCKTPFRIIHRSLLRALEPISIWLGENRAVVDYLNSEANMDFGNKQVLVQALIGASLVENHRGISLIASRTIERTRENIRIAFDPETRRVGQVLLSVLSKTPQLPQVIE